METLMPDPGVRGVVFKENGYPCSARGKRR